MSARNIDKDSCKPTYLKNYKYIYFSIKSHLTPARLIDHGLNLIPHSSCDYMQQESLHKNHTYLHGDYRTLDE